MITYLSTILSPDKSNFIIKLYHKSNKIIIPMMIPSLILSDNNNFKKYFDFLNINNFGFHSLVSFSTIITDYHKKLPYVNEKLLRLLNFKTHGILYIYFTYNLFNKHFDPLKYNFVELKRRETIPYNYLNHFND